VVAALARIERYTITREAEGIVIVMDSQDHARRARVLFSAAAVVVPPLSLWAVGPTLLGWVIAALSALGLVVGIRKARTFATYRERWVVTPRIVRLRRRDDAAAEEALALRDARMRLRWRVDELIHLDVLDAASATTGLDFQFTTPRSAEAFVEALRRSIRVELDRPGSV
jgi:hypothetical protein